MNYTGKEGQVYTGEEKVIYRGKKTPSKETRLPEGVVAPTPDKKEVEVSAQKISKRTTLKPKKLGVKGRLKKLVGIKS